MSRHLPALSDFDVVDESSIRLDGDEVREISLDASELAVGPLAEVIVLRKGFQKCGKAFRLSAIDDPRYQAMSRVAQGGRASFSREDGFGVLFIGSAGESSELAAHEFVLEAGKQAAGAGLEVAPARLLRGAFGELISNVHEHAGPDARGLAAFEMAPGGISLVIADAGQGVVQGYLSTSPQLRGLTAVDALEMAVKQHRSRIPEPGRGTGFSTVVRAMRTMDASLRVRSDDASIEIEGTGDAGRWMLREQVRLRGFVVSLHLRWS